jgi:hypothetical protein
MTRTLVKSLMAIGLVSGSMSAFADPGYGGAGWDGVCTGTLPVHGTGAYIANSRANDLFRVEVGDVGIVNYDACFSNNPHNIAGRIGFASGPVGSGQSSFDDDMLYTFGMPFSAAGNWSYAVTRRLDPTAAAGTAPTSTLFGKSLSGNFFAGASGRYIYIEQTADNIVTRVRTDVMGDGCRVRWEMTNIAATGQQLGLWYGAQLGILKADLSDASGLFGSPCFITFPGHKPLLVDGRYTRVTNPGNFPPYVQFCFGQTNAYGLQVDLGPTSATTDPDGNNSNATNVDELVVGRAPFVIGDPNASPGDTDNPGDFVFGDVGLGSEQFLIKYEPQTGGTIAANHARTIFTYFRDTWGNSKYTRTTDVPGPNFGNPVPGQPYSTVVDAPHLLNPDDGSGGATNGLQNNPFIVRAYVDNTGGYSNVYVASQINDVRVRLNLPPGMSFSNGDSAEKVISRIDPLQMSFVEWQVEADGIEVGDLPYTVTITSIPGPPQNAPIVHAGTIRVAATKQIKLEPAANLISSPWEYADSSWEAVLGMTSPADFTAYEWDPVQNSYVISTSAARGVGVWLILNPNTHPSEEVDPFIGAQTPTDTISGTGNMQLHAGWNLIGDPYPWAIPVTQLVGVSASNGGQAYSFADLVSQNVVTPYLAYWDPSVNNYRYVQGIQAMLQPHKGYWIKVLTSQDLTLVFPPVFDTFVPGGRAANESGGGWNQTSDHWRLNIQAKGTGGTDIENYLGVAVGTQARVLQIPEPPMGPTQSVSASFDGAIANQNARMAQALSNHAGNLQWKLAVQTKQAGSTVLSWPNMDTLPRNLTFRLTDTVTGQTIDMRSRTSVSYLAAANSTRQFTIQSTGSGVVPPTISTLTAAPGKLANRVPVTGTVKLNVDASTTVRVLDQQGNPVAVVGTGMSYRKGNNYLSWDLKNSSGVYVQAGRYQIAVDTTTADGYMDSKSVTIMVNR